MSNRSEQPGRITDIARRQSKSGDLDETAYMRKFGSELNLVDRRPLIDVVMPQPKTSKAFFAKLNAPKVKKSKPAVSMDIKRVSRRRKAQ